MYYNLLDEEWIPVLCRDGKVKRVGIHKAFEEAGRIRQIAASNPMDRVAIQRFLLALLYWCKGNSPDRASSGASFPNEWFKKFGDNKNCFNLLGDGKRFYQDKSTPSNDRPIGDLLVEFPTETKIAHFRHVRDKEYGLCPACCALGIIRFCTWANAYGGGRYTSAVNGPTAAYAIPQAETLFRTLIVNWIPAQTSQREPPWLNNVGPRKASDLNMATVLGWRSRRIWLGDIGNNAEVCAYCGRRAKLIKQMAFTGGWGPPFKTKGQEKKFWDKDPHLILVEKRRDDEGEENSPVTESDESRSQGRRRTKDAAKKTTLGFPIPGSRVSAHTRFWRRALHGIITSKDTPGDDAAKAIILAGPAANKGLYQDAAAIQLISPSAKSAAAASLGVLSKAVESMGVVLKRSTPNPKRQHPNRKAALDALSPLLEANLRTQFEAITNASVMSRDLAERLGPVVENVVRATTPGSPLRLREALRRARQELTRAIEDAATNDSQPPTPDAPDKAKRRRRRGRGV